MLMIWELAEMCVDTVDWFKLSSTMPKTDRLVLQDGLKEHRLSILLNRLPFPTIGRMFMQRNDDLHTHIKLSILFNLVAIMSITTIQTVLGLGFILVSAALNNGLAENPPLLVSMGCLAN